MATAHPSTSTSTSQKARKCNNILCKHRNLLLPVAGKHDCGGCKYGKFTVSMDEAAAVDAEQRLAAQSPPKPFRYDWEHEDGYIIDWKGYQEFQRQAKLVEIEKRKIGLAKLEAAGRARQRQLALQRALEEDEWMIDPFAKNGPLGQPSPKSVFADSKIFELLASPGNSDLRSIKSHSSSRSSESKKSNESQTSHASTTSTTSSSLHSAFSHRFDKPLPKLPAYNSMRYQVTPPLSLNKGRHQKQPKQCKRSNHQVLVPPTSTLPPLPRAVATIPTRMRPVSTLDVPKEVDQLFYDSYDI
ncbi:hypothetical protein VKT23_006738 [Stygiomarasmius scandens]|uniref:Uncharacterized protein n=1 Tax=Marasmiellus scandens TaxID=2682957 RepID=A0ABR1JKQ6_9AGAR